MERSSESTEHSRYRHQISGQLASEEILNLPRQALVDCRNDACGFDFRCEDGSQRVVEVKGLRESAGSVLFTDRERRVAEEMRQLYLVVIVGRVFANPIWKVIPSPTEAFALEAVAARQVTINWTASVEL